MHPLTPLRHRWSLNQSQSYDDNWWAAERYDRSENTSRCLSDVRTLSLKRIKIIGLSEGRVRIPGSGGAAPATSKAVDDDMGIRRASYDRFMSRDVSRDVKNDATNGVTGSRLTTRLWLMNWFSAISRCPSCRSQDARSFVVVLLPNTHRRRDADATQLSSWVASASAVYIGRVDWKCRTWNCRTK